VWARRKKVKEKLPKGATELLDPRSLAVVDTSGSEKSEWGERNNTSQLGNSHRPGGRLNHSKGERTDTRGGVGGRPRPVKKEKSKRGEFRIKGNPSPTAASGGNSRSVMGDVSASIRESGQSGEGGRKETAVYIVVLGLGEQEDGERSKGLKTY